MTTSVRRHHHRLLLLAALAALVLGTLALFAWRAEPALPDGTRLAPAQSVLVLRSAAGHDALWLLSPVDGTPTAAGQLPGRAWAVAQSPDGRHVAYLPEGGSPKVWIGSGPLALKTLSLAGAGVRRIDSFCWLDGDRLLVAGVTRRVAGIRLDRLYVVNAVTGKVSWFRGLYGAEPSFAPSAREVAYIRFTLVTAGTATRPPLVRESLKVLRLDGTGGGRTVWTEENASFAESRGLAQPQISPDGRWFLTQQTGSDVRVTYDIRDRWGYPQLSLFTPALPAAGGWDATGRRTAFAGVTDISGVSGCIWVYDVDSGWLVRSAAGLVPSAMIGSVGWSAAGQLVANAYIREGDVTTRHNLVLSGDLGTCTDIGRGRLPVWVTPAE